MVRPLKYRAWLKQKRKMSYDIGGIDFHCWDIYVDTCLVRDRETEKDEKYWFAPHRFYLMARTGWQDSKWVDIYEWDILEVDWNDSRYPKHLIWPVTRDEEDGCFRLGEWWSPKDDAKHHMTVVGNIYQHKKLLAELK